MIFTFFKARGFPVGNSMVEDAQTDLAKQLVGKAAEKGVKLLLPTDIIVADKYAADAQTQVVSADRIPEGWMVSPAPVLNLGLDGGPWLCLGFRVRILSTAYSRSIQQDEGMTFRVEKFAVLNQNEQH